MPPEISGYLYGGSIQVDELCGFFNHSDSGLNKMLDNLDTDYTAKAVGCASVAVSSGVAVWAGVLSSWAGWTAIGTVCGSMTLGCFVNDVIRGNTPCGSQIINVYVPETIDDGPEYPPVLLIIRCNKDVSDDIESIANNLSQDLENAADDAAEIIVETGQEVARQLKDAAESVEDFTDDLINAGDDIIF